MNSARELEEHQETLTTCDVTPFIGPVLMREGGYGSS